MTRLQSSRRAAAAAVVVTVLPMMAAFSFSPCLSPRTILRKGHTTQLFSDWNDNSQDSNQWESSIPDGPSQNPSNAGEDWLDVLAQKKEGTYWSSFESSDEANGAATKKKKPQENEDAFEEAWLDTLASISAEEVEFNMKEADRADRVRQMQEWGFEDNVIANTLGVATDTSLETKEEVAGMQSFREESYLDEIDLETVESHTQVPMDDETGEPVRQQMVYVDEHTCIGCTNCAMIAQSTFYMNSEHGRARVFQQWGDDDETIQVAIETCPVDCIHYVPYDELVKLEVERRTQNINFKARLVSQAEYGNTMSHMSSGPAAFTAPQQISGNMKARCNNCPSRGCRNCPMFGVGKNPEYERKERERMERMERRRVARAREEAQKSADL